MPWALIVWQNATYWLLFFIWSAGTVSLIAGLMHLWGRLDDGQSIWKMGVVPLALGVFEISAWVHQHRKKSSGSLAEGEQSDSGSKPNSKLQHLATHVDHDSARSSSDSKGRSSDSFERHVQTRRFV